MNIFVSWSGDLSQKVASLLHKYLPCMVQDLEVFVSRHDIESGVRWASRLAEELERSDFGILCLTRENLSNDWLVFEAGALSKEIEGRACGLLVDGLRPTDITGPLAQFQHREFAEAEFRMMMHDLNASLERPLQREKVELIFNKWWPDIYQEYMGLIEIAQLCAPASMETRQESDIMEEILSLSRTIAAAVVKPAVTPPPKYIITKENIESLSKSQQLLLFEIRRLKTAGEFDKAQELAEQNKDEVNEICRARLASWDSEGKIKVPVKLAKFVTELDTGSE